MATDDLYTDYTHYISIDFGTSGCAIAVGFSKPEPKKIYVFSAWGKRGRAGVGVKYPTVLLADPQGAFVSFGDKAFDAFKQLTKDQAQDHYLFHRFKMKLYDAPNAKFIEAANGRSLPAVDVFAMTLKFLKDTAMEWICKLTEHPCRRIQWIVTVPAIWSDAAKDVMRKAAMKVDLKKESMVFAYEPEAAALFTQYDFLHSEECFTQFCYLVVDCGGGTVDIAAHRITKQHGNIVINDIAPPHGGNCGGFAVNDQFEKLLLDILKISPEKFQQLKINCAVQWNTLMNETFEENKTIIDPKDNFSSITLNVPLMIYNEIENIAGKSLEELISDYGDENIEWDEDEFAIILNYSVINKLFEPVLDEICKLIKAVLAKNECNEVKTILLVGGFAESPYLFQRIEDTFGKEYNVNRSTTPVFSVVKGAVLCGQQERLIKPLLEKIKDQSTTLKPESSPPQNDVYTDIQPDDTQLESQHTASVSQSPTLQTEQTLSPPMQQVKSPMQTVKYLPPAITKQLPPLENMPDQPPSQNNESTNTQSVFGSPQPIESPKQIVKHLPPAFTKHLPLVLSRKMKHTVGVETVEEFQNGHHNVNKMVLIDKEPYCEDIFFTLVRANESVKAGSPKRVYKFVPATEKQSTCIINIFASNQEDVKYIDDEGCQHRAKVEINIPHDASESREIELCVNFYNTEVEIEVYSVNNKEIKKIPVDYEFFHAQP